MWVFSIKYYSICVRTKNTCPPSITFMQIFESRINFSLQRACLLSLMAQSPEPFPLASRICYPLPLSWFSVLLLLKLVSRIRLWGRTPSNEDNMQSPPTGVMIKTNYRFMKVVYCQFHEFPDQKISSENIHNSSIKQTEQVLFVDIYLYMHKELYKPYYW